MFLANKRSPDECRAAGIRGMSDVCGGDDRFALRSQSSRSWSSGLLRRKPADTHEMAFVTARAEPGCIRVGMVGGRIGGVRNQPGLVRCYRAFEQQKQACPRGMLAPGGMP